MKYFKFVLIAVLFLFSCQPSLYRTDNIPQIDDQLEVNIYDLYQQLELVDQLEFKIFRMAMVGFHHIDILRKDIITIIDYSQPSTEKRLFIIDLINRKLLFNTLIAHGKNSGENLATVFSNVPESYTSSIGC